MPLVNMEDLPKYTTPAPAYYTAPATGKTYDKNQWQQVAYDNAYNAYSNLGTDLGAVNKNQPKYGDANLRAWNDWLASQGGGGGKSSGSGSSGSGLLPSLAGGNGAQGKPAPVAPTMAPLPSLNMSKGASTVYQLNKLQSLDSVPMQQAEINARERGAATGAIHGSQQAGAAQRAVQNAMTPLAQSEANLVGSEDIANWQTEVTRIKDVYEKQYAGYLAELGIESNEKQAMLAANTSLSQALMGNITSLLGNPEIDFGPEVKNKLTSIFNTGLQNNNVILDMGFSYA